MVYYYLVEGENQTDGNAFNKSWYWEKHTCANLHIRLRQQIQKEHNMILDFSWVLGCITFVYVKDERKKCRGCLKLKRIDFSFKVQNFFQE